MNRVSVFNVTVFTFLLLFFQAVVAGAEPINDGPIGFYLTNQGELGLTADQVLKLQAINVKFQKQKAMEKARIQVIQKEGMQLLMQKDVNTGILKKDIDRVLKHKKNIMVARVQMLADAHKILTDVQFDKVKKLWRQMMMNHGVHPMMGHPAVGH